MTEQKYRYRIKALWSEDYKRHIQQRFPLEEPAGFDYIYKTSGHSFNALGAVKGVITQNKDVKFWIKHDGINTGLKRYQDFVIERQPISDSWEEI